MAVERSVISKVKKVVFSKFEPSSSLVMWGKPTGNKFTFWVFDDGTWQQVSESDGIVIPEVSVDLSAFHNDVGYITSAQLPDLSKVATTGSYFDLLDKPISADSNGIISFIIGGQHYKVQRSGYDFGIYTYINGAFTEILPPGSALQRKLVSGTNIKTINNQSILGQGDITIQGSGEANVIESISVNNTPVAPDANKNVNITVPAAVTESTVSGWGFTKNAGTYSKPSSGIPASDLAQGVIPDVSGKEDKMLLTIASGTALTAEAGHYYRFDNTVGTLTVTLPTPTTLANVILFFTTSATPNVTLSHSSILYHEDYEIEAESTYEVNCLWNGIAWIVASIKIGG